MQRSECDSPLALTNYTFDYLEKEWASDVDFVICECRCEPRGLASLTRASVQGPAIAHGMYSQSAMSWW